MSFEFMVTRLAEVYTQREKAQKELKDLTIAEDEILNEMKRQSIKEAPQPIYETTAIQFCRD